MEPLRDSSAALDETREEGNETLPEKQESQESGAELYCGATSTSGPVYEDDPYVGPKPGGGGTPQAAVGPVGVAGAFEEDETESKTGDVDETSRQAGLKLKFRRRRLELYVGVRFFRRPAR